VARLYLGLAFFPKDPAYRHLCMVLSDPERAPKVVRANVSSQPCPSGEIFVLEKTHHSALSHRSYLRFQGASLSPAAAISEGIDSGVLQQTKDLDAAICREIQRQLGNSKYVKNEVVKMLREQGYLD